MSPFLFVMFLNEFIDFNVSLLSFFDHFKSVSSASTLEGDGFTDTTYDNDTVYEELELEIQIRNWKMLYLG
jgi:hypothetical protein